MSQMSYISNLPALSCQLALLPPKMTICKLQSPKISHCFHSKQIALPLPSKRSCHHCIKSLLKLMSSVLLNPSPCHPPVLVQPPSLLSSPQIQHAPHHKPAAGYLVSSVWQPGSTLSNVRASPPWMSAPTSLHSWHPEP